MMNRTRTFACRGLCAVVLFIAGSPAFGQTAGVNLHFVDVDRGKEILSANDAFMERLSPFDRQARMQSENRVSKEEFVDFISGEVRGWSDEQRAKVNEAFELIKPAIDAVIPKGLPPIEMVITTGREEGGAAYTRARAIVLPAARLDADKGNLAKLLAHEMFHVITRNDTLLRDGLYAIIGFRPVPEIILPPALADRRLTNPDAPVFEHVIRLREGQDTFALATPVLYASTDYNPNLKRQLFAYLEFQLMEVAKIVGGQYRAVDRGGEAVMHTPNHPDYGRQIGRNTGYIIHPEEILADNFSDLVTGRNDSPDPWVTEKMRGVFAVHAAR